MSGSCSQCGGAFARGYSHCGDHILAAEPLVVRQAFAAFVAGTRTEAIVHICHRAGLVERTGALTYIGRLAASAVDCVDVVAMKEAS